MKVLLICAGGMSTSILMKKMEKYAESKGTTLEIVAIGASDVEEHYKDFDVILLGPQISYKKDDIAALTGKPVAVIAPMDYALGNAENIFQQIGKIYPSA